MRTNQLKEKRERLAGKLLALMLIGLFALPSHGVAQGLSRNNGIGIRLGFWNMYDNKMTLRVKNSPRLQEVDINGFGFYLDYFSKVNGNWALTFDLGVVSGLKVQQDVNEINQNVDLNSVVSFLVGARYDLLSPKLPTKIIPYLSAGVGPYMQQRMNITQDSGVETVETSDGEFFMGGFLGGGVLLPVVDRLTLKVDMKYHFVDFAVQKGLSGMEFGVGLTYMFGKKQKMFRVRQTQLIVKDIYPAYYQFYNTYPLALVSVENMAGYPIEVNVKSTVKPYSLKPKETGFLKIEKNATRDIPVTAVFDNEIFNTDLRRAAVLDMEIEGRAGRTHSQAISAQLTVHTRNSWNGEMDKLGFFITPDEPAILERSRSWLAEIPRDSVAQLEKFVSARHLFEMLTELGIHYQADPNIPFYEDDRVQYATETLELKNGDCDDLVVLYGSLLESVGVRTAFVQVRDPEEKIAHLYLIFDSGGAPEQAGLISANRKKYLLRSIGGAESVWIPVETTLIPRGFEEAWRRAALNYLQEAQIRNGLEEGWVTIYDLH